MPWLLELTFEKPEEFTLNVLEEIEEKVENEIRDSLAIIAKVENEAKFIDSLIGEFKEFIKSIESRDTTDEIIRIINNYLNTYKSFLNYWERYAKGEKDTEFFNFYKSNLSKIYDTSFEYRFVYNLRNYASHGGRPLSKINKSLKEGTKLQLHRESFILDYKKMQAPFREELKKMDIDYLEVEKAIKVTHANLLNFHNLMVNETINSPNEEYLIASVEIMKFQKKYSKHNGTIALTSNETIENFRAMQNETLQIPLKYTELPVHVAKSIIKGAHIKFKYKGTYSGKSPSFPYLESESLLVSMPRFFSGRKYVERNGILWVQVTESLGTNWLDGYGRYFSLYMPDGLTVDEYMKEAEQYEEETERLFDKSKVSRI